MAGVRGKVPRTSVVGPSLGVNTALNQGARKSTSSSQAPDDMAAPSQPTDQLTDVTTAVDNSSSENVSNKDKQLDFSILPAHIWVNIFSGLNTRDRLNLSVTCWKLRDVCTSCSVLWRSAYIQIGGNHPHYKRVHLNKAGRSVLHAHCHQIKNLVIQVKCHWGFKLVESSYVLLSETAEKFPLKHLEVRSDSGRKSSIATVSKQMQNILRTCITSSSASELCYLEIPALDWTTNGKSGVVDTLENSSFTSSLTHLYLGLLIEKCSEQLCKAIGRFQNLQFLAVPFYCISNNLLNSFPKGLKEVHFVVHKLDLPKNATNWPQVLASLPQLTVGLIIVALPSIIAFHNLLPSVVPVSSIRFQEMSENQMCCSLHKIILQVLPKKCLHLKMLQCRFSPHERMIFCLHILPDKLIEDRLITTVRQCPALDHLNFSGSISSDAVLTLAAMRKWRVLEINAAFITFTDSTDREKDLQTLRAEVSRTLGRSWELRSWNEPHVNTRSTGMGLCFQAITPP